MTPWIIDPQALLSMGFCRQEYWSGLPFPLTCPSIPFQKQKLYSFSVVTPQTCTVLCRLFLGVGLSTALLSYIFNLLHPVCLSLHLQSGIGQSYQLLTLSSAISHNVSFMARLGPERHVDLPPTPHLFW